MKQVAICPTIDVTNPHDYRAQMEQIESFASRVHIDLMDGLFAPISSVPIKQVWWPEKLMADIHLMFQRPEEAISELIKLKPNLVIIHLEAEADHVAVAKQLHDDGIKAGLAILQQTPVEDSFKLIKNFDHCLFFSGNLGYQGGQADLGLLSKVKAVRARFPDIEISWDGGINDQNALALVEAGVRVLNVGGFIQKAENPAANYQKLVDIASHYQS